MSYGRNIMYDLTYNDQRYDRVSLGMQIPSLRRSVHHTRESARHPASPPSFRHPDGILPPVSFRFATESHHITAISVNQGQEGDEINPMLPIFNEPADSLFHFPRHFMNAEPDYPISRFRLFKLTEAAVGRILYHLSSMDLAALALVDKDCCQLVRTRLFRSVWLLVLTRDAYADGSEPLWDFEEPQEGMEVGHRKDMIRYARRMAKVVPALEWVHFGQIPMAAERGIGDQLMVVPLQERADLTTFLSELWCDRRAKRSSRV